MLLTKQQILEVKDLKTEKVYIEEWGGDVYVKTLTGAERDRFEKSILTPDGKRGDFENLRAKLVIEVCVDKDGKRIFTQKDLLALGGKCAGALDKIFDIGQRLSGITKKDVDDMTKN